MKMSTGCDLSIAGDGSSVEPEEARGALNPAVAELAAVLGRRCRYGVHIDVDGWCEERARIDIIASGRRERVGIVCDATDAMRLQQHASLLETSFVHRVLGCSALDAIMDPEAVADAIARATPSLFRVSSRKPRRHRQASHLVSTLSQDTPVAHGVSSANGGKDTGRPGTATPAARAA